MQLPFVEWRTIGRIETSKSFQPKTMGRGCYCCNSIRNHRIRKSVSYLQRSYCEISHISNPILHQFVSISYHQGNHLQTMATSQHEFISKAGCSAHPAHWFPLIEKSKIKKNPKKLAVPFNLFIGTLDSNIWFYICKKKKKRKNEMSRGEWEGAFVIGRQANANFLECLKMQQFLFDKS